MALRRLISIAAMAALLVGPASAVFAAEEEPPTAQTQVGQPSARHMLPPPGAPFGPMMPTRPFLNDKNLTEKNEKPIWFFSNHLFRHAQFSIEEEKN